MSEAQEAAEKAYPLVTKHGISYRNVELEQAFIEGWRAKEATLEPKEAEISDI